MRMDVRKYVRYLTYLTPKGYQNLMNEWSKAIYEERENNDSN